MFLWWVRELLVAKDLEVASDEGSRLGGSDDVVQEPTSCCGEGIGKLLDVFALTLLQILASEDDLYCSLFISFSEFTRTEEEWRVESGEVSVTFAPMTAISAVGQA